LGLGLPLLREWIGMPTPVLWALAGIALLFAGNAALAYHFAGQWAGRWLAWVMIGNLAYCLLTTSLVVLHLEELRPLGVAYFVGEILVILGLVLYEGRALRAAAAPPLQGEG
jgi:hypothetical protein